MMKPDQYALDRQSIAPLRIFVQGLTELVSAHHGDERTLLARGEKLLSSLLTKDTWLPDFCAVADKERYRQYLLYCDPLERFSVVSFVWSGGQQTPIHDHTVWGLVGVLRGAEMNVAYQHQGAELVASTTTRMEVGDVAPISVAEGDVHQVSNAYQDQDSISIHVYGGNIGKIARHVYEPLTGQQKTFVSGYSNTVLPNIWV